MRFTLSLASLTLCLPALLWSTVPTQAGCVQSKKTSTKPPVQSPAPPPELYPAQRAQRNTHVPYRPPSDRISQPTNHKTHTPQQNKYKAYKLKLLQEKQRLQEEIKQKEEAQKRKLAKRRQAQENLQKFFVEEPVPYTTSQILAHPPQNPIAHSLAQSLDSPSDHGENYTASMDE